jgi:hypothetical protein
VLNVLPLANIKSDVDAMIVNIADQVKAVVKSAPSVQFVQTNMVAPIAKTVAN